MIKLKENFDIWMDRLKDTGEKIKFVRNDDVKNTTTRVHMVIYL